MLGTLAGKRAKGTKDFSSVVHLLVPGPWDILIIVPLTLIYRILGNSLFSQEGQLFQ